MILDTKKKFQLVDEIIEHLEKNYTYQDCDGYLMYKEERVRILLERFDIIYTQKHFNSSYLENADDKNIVELAEYLLNDKGLSHLFHDKYAIDILSTEEKFFNLNLYLQECFECIKTNRRIATAILLRSCVQILVDMCGYKGRSLAASIDQFIPSMENNETFIMFSNCKKQNELKQFLEGIKDFGNDVAHLNGKNVKDFIEKYDNKELLKLFCILIEHSILKDDIRKRNERDVENRVKSIDFSIKEKVIAPNTTSYLEASSDEEIPF